MNHSGGHETMSMVYVHHPIFLFLFLKMIFVVLFGVSLMCWQ